MGCNCNQPTPCNQPPALCECPTILKSDCVVFSGNDLPCSGITTGQTLTETVEQLDTFICEKVNDITNALTLKNIGTGSEVYKGVDLLGRKEIRKINAVGSLATVTQNANDISVSINEANLDTFIEANQKTYTVANVGTGAQAYKDSTIVGNNTQYNFRTIVKQDLGDGVSFLRDIQENTNELNVRVKTLVSDNLTITSTDDEVRIETPMTSSIPALYVNDLYIPTYQEWLSENSAQNAGVPVAGFEFIGRGNLAVPFTNTYVYTLGAPATPPVITANSAIQNALDGDTVYSYVGSGTRLSPDKAGQKIKIQDNTSTYTFTGNFGYSRIDLEIGGNVTTTTTGYLIDMDNALHFNALSDRVSINILEGYVLEITGDGLNNSGTNVATSIEVQNRQMYLLGVGRIISVTNDITKYLINSDILSSGNNNDGSLTFRIECNIYSRYQGILKIGGVSRVWNFGTIQSSDPNSVVDVNLKPYLLLGGSFRSFEGSRLEFSEDRVDAFVFTPTLGFTPEMIGKSASLSSLGTITNLFNKTNNNNATLVFSNSDSSVNFNIINVFESTNLWSVIFNRNIFETGIIDNTKVDLTSSNTISVSNSIGANLIENLRIFNDRTSAISAGVPLYSAYIKTNGNAYPSTATWVRDIVLPA